MDLQMSSCVSPYLYLMQHGSAIKDQYVPGMPGRHTLRLHASENTYRCIRINQETGQVCNTIFDATNCTDFGHYRSHGICLGCGGRTGWQGEGLTRQQQEQFHEIVARKNENYTQELEAIKGFSVTNRTARTDAVLLGAGEQDDRGRLVGEALAFVYSCAALAMGAGAAGDRDKFLEYCSALEDTMKSIVRTLGVAMDVVEVLAINVLERLSASMLTGPLAHLENCGTQDYHDNFNAQVVGQSRNLTNANALKQLTGSENEDPTSFNIMNRLNETAEEGDWHRKIPAARMFLTDIPRGDNWLSTACGSESAAVKIGQQNGAAEADLKSNARALQYAGTIVSGIKGLVRHFGHRITEADALSKTIRKGCKEAGVDPDVMVEAWNAFAEEVIEVFPACSAVRVTPLDADESPILAFLPSQHQSDMGEASYICFGVVRHIILAQNHCCSMLFTDDADVSILDTVEADFRAPPVTGWNRHVLGAALSRVRSAPGAAGLVPAEVREGFAQELARCVTAKFFGPGRQISAETITEIEFRPREIETELQKFNTGMLADADANPLPQRLEAAVNNL
ncbi:hypothetical protein KIPB_010288, partial [Kipferlia bialata]|eukprot:g10288.t1